MDWKFYNKYFLKLLTVFPHITRKHVFTWSNNKSKRLFFLSDINILKTEPQNQIQEKEYLRLQHHRLWLLGKKETEQDSYSITFFLNLTFCLNLALMFWILRMRSIDITKISDGIDVENFFYVKTKDIRELF